MTAIRCLCSRCAGDIIYTNLDNYFEAHPEVVADMAEGSKSRHPSGRRLSFPDGSQLDGDLVRSSSGAEWRQLRLFELP